MITYYRTYWWLAGILFYMAISNVLIRGQNDYRLIFFFKVRAYFSPDYIIVSFDNKPW